MVSDGFKGTDFYSESAMVNILFYFFLNVLKIKIKTMINKLFLGKNERHLIKA